MTELCIVDARLVLKKQLTGKQKNRAAFLRLEVNCGRAGGARAQVYPGTTVNTSLYIVTYYAINCSAVINQRKDV
jgi:hypothetical protein